MKKILFFVQDQEYRNGLERFLNYYPEHRSSVELLATDKHLERIEDAIILSDCEELPKGIRDKNLLYRLSTNSVTARNEIYKYSNIKTVMEELLQEDSGEEDAYHIYTISSSSEGAGKTLIAKSLAEILSKHSVCAFLNLLSGDNEIDISLSELILMALKKEDSDLYLRSNEKGFYEIEGFRLLRDYRDLDPELLKTLLSRLHRSLGIHFFLIELPFFTDRTSEEILKLSKLNLIISDSRKKNQEHKLIYLKELSETARDSIVIENFCTPARNETELPLMRMSEDEISFLERDYYLFQHRLAQCLGEHYA